MTADVNIIRLPWHTSWCVSSSQICWHSGGVWKSISSTWSRQDCRRQSQQRRRLSVPTTAATLRVRQSAGRQLPQTVQTFSRKQLDDSVTRFNISSSSMRNAHMPEIWETAASSLMTMAATSSASSRRTPPRAIDACIISLPMQLSLTRCSPIATTVRW